MNYIYPLLVIVFFSIFLPLECTFSLKKNPQGQVSKEISMAQFGETQIFFYSEQEKDRFSRDFISDISDNILYGVFTDTPNFPAPYVVPLVSKYADPIDYDSEGHPVYIDQKGMDHFLAHVQRIKSRVETALELQIEKVSQGLCLVLNFDANKFQRDYFESPNYDLSDSYFVKDLTLIDWQMSEGTFSSTVLQDSDSDDRFIFPLLPKGVVNSFFAEPALTARKKSIMQYPAHFAFPLHLNTAPIDRDSSFTPGSAKGKHVCVSLQGIVAQSEIKNLQKKSHHLPINRPQLISGDKKSVFYKYPSGLIVKQIPFVIPVDSSQPISVNEVENMEVLETAPEDNDQLIKVLADLFDLNAKGVKVKHCIKRDSGFTQFANEKLDIPLNCKVVLINHSKIPSGYRYYQIGQDFTKTGLPWIQLYHLPPTMAMCVSGTGLPNLSLTPTEEILFRDASHDHNQKKLDIVQSKFTTQIDMFIFPDH